MFSLDSFDYRSFNPISWAPADESHLTDEELREDYHGGRPRRTRKGKLHRDALRPFSDATESDLRTLVEAKWEAIEARRAQETPVPSTRPEPSVQKTPEIAHEVVLAMPLAKQALPDVPPLTAAVDPEATEARRLRQQRNDEHALVLMLAEMI